MLDRSRGLLEHLGVFEERLRQAGYSPLTAREKLRFVTQLLRSRDADGDGIEDLDEEQIDAHVAQKRGQGRRRTLLQFLDHLRERGVAAPRSNPPDASPAAQLVERYECHLRQERGLAPRTLLGYRRFVRPFLDEWFGRGGKSLKGLTYRQVDTFLLRRAPTMMPKTAQLMGSALRSFLRFAFFAAETRRDLSLAVPMVRQFHKAAVPKFLPAKDVERVLASCDLTRPVGRRDRALLLLVARLGLRGGEIVRLELGDLRWRSGELVVRGKGQVHDLLPLPKDAGEALAQYLTQDRPRCSSRRVFLRMRAPLRGFANVGAVTTIVQRAVARAGLRPPQRGPHLLRHSLATSMIQQGATMAEIGQLLRHRSAASTELYAKVDFEGLRGIALPWPGTRGGR
jgi:site-specific recombinase XerD